MFKFPDDVKGWLTEREGKVLHNLATGKDVLEVGSFAGRSTICMAQAAQLVVSVDSHHGDQHTGPADTLAEFTANLERYGVQERVATRLGSLEDLHSTLPTYTFDLCFLGAYHAYDDVLRHLDLILPLCRKSAVLAIHDYNNHNYPGVQFAVDRMFLDEPVSLVDSLAILPISRPAQGMTLNIVTPVSRAANLEKIAENIKQSFKKLTVRWHCFYDDRKVAPGIKNECYSQGYIEGDIGGNPQRNAALDTFNDGWVYFLDDDNLIHPEFEEAFLEATYRHPQARGFMFNQIELLFQGRARKSGMASYMYGNIDPGQFVLRRSLIGPYKFEVGNYSGDWIFLRDATYGRQREIICIDKNVTYYNALREKT